MKKNILKKQNKSLGFLLSIFFLIYGFWPLINSDSIRIWSLIIGVIFFGIVIFYSKLLSPLSLLLVKLGELIGRVVSPIVMAFIYFVIITPLAIVLRFFGKDLLKTKFNSKTSYWIDRKKNINSMKKQF